MPNRDPKTKMRIEVQMQRINRLEQQLRDAKQRLRDLRANHMPRSKSEMCARNARIGHAYRLGLKEPPREFKDAYLARRTNRQISDMIHKLEAIADSNRRYGVGGTSTQSRFYTNARVARRLKELYAECKLRSI